MALGHEALSHLGSLKPPVYETSTFVFETAEEGKRFFEQAYGNADGEAAGYIYSRLDSPNLGPAEARLARWEEAEDAAIFSSGMGAITSVLLTFLRPGDLVLYSTPTYGGTSTLMNGLLTEFGVATRPFRSDATAEDLEELIGDGSLAMVYVETPANPTNALTDIGACAEVARTAGGDDPAIVAVDNTFLGPLWQHPLEHGADLVLYSLTKFVGGHSDLIAGACLGPADLISEIKATRTFLGSMAGPWTGWLLLRSLETLKLRMTS
ncbi:MAG: aminotransferase class I/II-fold pyridoxal phosphate-dependent enzyme, partial [Halobacteriales archaeon]|nr:aminotransferase class I/II-fold pyridoxal phosphate-dependent enzyme [Halobacteriales archaeon]